MSKHCYALLDADGTILRTTSPRDTAPAPVILNGATMIWQQVVDDAPAHPAYHEVHSPTFRMIGHRVHRVFQTRPKKS